MKNIIKMLLAAIIAVTPMLSQAETVTLVLKNGTTLVGELVSLDPTSVVEIAIAGINTKINFSDIEKIEKKEEVTTTPSVQSPNFPKEKILNIAGIDIKFILVEGQTFTYGYDGEMSKSIKSEPVHEITVSPFYVSVDPVSRDLYTAVTGKDPWSEYTLTYVYEKKKPEINEEREAIINSIKDVALFNITNNKDEIIPFDGFNCIGEIAKNLPTADSFVKELNKQSLEEKIDLLNEAQWASIHKSRKEVNYPLRGEIVRSINMNQSSDPNTVGYTIKGITTTIRNRWKTAHVDEFDNRLPFGEFKINEKKKEIIYWGGDDFITPIHLVFPANK